MEDIETETDVAYCPGCDEEYTLLEDCDYCPFCGCEEITFGVD